MDLNFSLFVGEPGIKSLHDIFGHVFEVESCLRESIYHFLEATLDELFFFLRLPLAENSFFDRFDEKFEICHITADQRLNVLRCTWLELGN